MSGYESITSDDIFFGSRQVFMRQVPGSVVHFSTSEGAWLLDKSEEGKQKVIQRLGQHHVEGSEHPVVIPGIPAMDFVSSGKVPSCAVDLPPFMMKPVMKCPEQENTLVDGIAIASGHRSALLKASDGRFYRLKGCGNDDKGFPVRLTRAGETYWQDVRGSAFPHTTVSPLLIYSLHDIFYNMMYVIYQIRELAITTLLSQALDTSGIVSANEAVAYYIYDEQPFPTVSDARPTCIIERTIGDRRLGTHVLAGLELLLPHFLSEADIDTAKLFAAFPEKRPGKESGSIENISETGAIMTDYMLGTSLAGSEADGKGFSWPDLDRDGSILAFMGTSDTALPEKTPETGVYPDQWTNEGPVPMSQKWRTEWDDTCMRLKHHLEALRSKSPNTNGTNLLAYLYSRMGLDAGRVLRGIHSSGLSWGTYQDAMCRKDYDEWHCNAHANNFVIIAEDTFPSDHPKGHSILSFLDLDMAFSRDAFISDDGHVGVSSKQFSDILWREHVSLMEVLAGNDSSTGVPQVARSVVESREAKFKAVQSSLYDTLIMGYLYGFFDGDQGGKYAVMDFDEELHAAAYCMIRLAIIVMADFVA